jgi:hypothetical protein
MNKKIKFLPTNIPEYKWRIREGIGNGILNVVINNFKRAGVKFNKEPNTQEYVPFSLSDDYLLSMKEDNYSVLEQVKYKFEAKITDSRLVGSRMSLSSWSPLMSVPDYNKQDASRLFLKSTDIRDCIYKLHDMFPQFTEYWDIIGVSKEEYWKEILEKCESYEILGVTAVTTDLVKGNKNYKIPVNSVVSYLVDGEIKSVVFDKKLHRII